VRPRSWPIALSGDDPRLTPLKQLLIARTEGNPFFLEESVRTQVETVVLVGAPGAYRLVQTLPTIQMPATVQAVLAARIDRLPPEEKRLLQMAAVTGTEVPLPLLQAIAELPEAALHGRLAHLQAAEFLYETRLFPDHEYTFKHALTHEVAYSSLLQERRRALHTRIVKALETLSADRTAEQVERLAHHALRGEVWDKALAYCRQAGEKAMVRSAYREPVEYFEQALGALPHLPEQRATHEQAIDLRLALRSALRPLGEQGRILGHLREAAALAEGLHDQGRLGRAISYMSDYFWRVGHHEQAIEAGQRALALGRAREDFGRQVAANVFLGRAYITLGGYRQAIGFLRQNVASLEGALVREYFDLTALPAVLSRAYLAWGLAELGAFAEGIATGEEGVWMAKTVDHPYSLLIASGGLGMLYLLKGECHQALPVLEASVELCRVWNIRDWFPLIASTLGAVYTVSGRMTEALPLLEQAVNQATSMGILCAQSRRVAQLSEALLLVGRWEEAVRLAGRAHELAREQHERGHQAWVLRLLGKIHVHGLPPEIGQAEDEVLQARALAEALGVRPLQAHCYLDLGALSLRMGRGSRPMPSCPLPSRSTARWTLTFWLPQAEAALAQVEGR
jgi:tetratricopeptide (TPR) repeat protein